jgi:trichohyalin
MIVVVTVFVMMLQNVSQRNQALNDRLIDFAMKDKNVNASAPVVVQSAPAQDNSVLVALTARMEQMQKQIERQNSEEAEKSGPPPASPSPEEIAREKKLQEEKAKLEQDRIRLKQEEKRLAEEKERLRREEVERYRRRMYPEHYSAEGKSESTRKPEVKTAPVQDNAALSKLTTEVELLRKELEANKKELEKKAAEAATPKSPSPAEIAQKEKLEAEKRKIELERLRLKIEQSKLEEEKEMLQRKSGQRSRKDPKSGGSTADDELELDDDSAIEYFKSDSNPLPPPSATETKRKNDDVKAVKKEAPVDYFDIPVDVKSVGGASWRIPEE